MKVSLETKPQQLDLVDVVTWSRERLETAMKAGDCPDPARIAGWEWNGYNVPFFAKVLGFRKFKKGFVSQGDRVEGYNVKVVQVGGPLDPWIPRRDRDGKPQRHGFYDVIAPMAPDDLYPNSLLIDYGCGRNPTLDPSSLLRDYIVSLGPDTMLGKAYGALGRRRRVHLSWFVLQRANRVEDY